MACAKWHSLSILLSVVLLALIHASSAALNQFDSQEAPAPGKVRSALKELRQVVPNAIQEMKAKIQPFMANLSDAAQIEKNITDTVRNGKQAVIKRIQDLIATGNADEKDVLALGSTITTQFNKIVQTFMTLMASSELPATDMEVLIKELNAVASEMYSHTKSIIKKLLPKQKRWGSLRLFI